MLLTDRMVVIHLPKTGGTFVRHALGKVYGICSVRSLDSLCALPRAPGEKFFIRTPWKHLPAEKIPPAFRALPVVSMLQDPLRRFRSQYEWAAWLQYQHQYPGVESIPGFPNIQFQEFVRAANERLWLTGRARNEFRRQGVGWQTASFVHWYCEASYQDEIAAGRSVDAEGIVSRLVVDRFLSTCRLSTELAGFLAPSISSGQYEMLRGLPPLVRIGHRPSLVAEPDASAIDMIAHSERILIDVFHRLRKENDIDRRLLSPSRLLAAE